MAILLEIFFAFAILAWVIKKIWETRYGERTGLAPENLWKSPTPADIKRRTYELEQKIDQIEKLVGLDKDPIASVSIFEGLVDWEDFVEPGFEREKEQWFKLNKQLSSLTRESDRPGPMRSHPPCPPSPEYLLRNILLQNGLASSWEDFNNPKWWVEYRKNLKNRGFPDLGKSYPSEWFIAALQFERKSVEDLACASGTHGDDPKPSS